MSQADRIGDGGKRLAFLRKVKVNREIMAEVGSGVWDIQRRDAGSP